MKQFLIYQFFIDRNYNERNLLIGIIKANSQEEAKQSYVDAKYKDGHKDFIKGYLIAHETKKENITEEMMQVLPKNARELGVWYSEGLIDDSEFSKSEVSANG